MGVHAGWWMDLERAETRAEARLRRELNAIVLVCTAPHHDSMAAFSEDLQLLGEKTALERMISETPTEDVLDRASLVARLKTVEVALGQARPEEQQPARVPPTFKGRSVSGSHGLLKEIRGELRGVLPRARAFEFKLADSGQVMRGKIGPRISDPDALNGALHRPTRIKVRVTRVGSGRPRYLLLEPPAST